MKSQTSVHTLASSRNTVQNDGFSKCKQLSQKSTIYQALRDAATPRLRTSTLVWGLLSDTELRHQTISEGRSSDCALKEEHLWSWLTDKHDTEDHLPYKNTTILVFSPSRTSMVHGGERLLWGVYSLVTGLKTSSSAALSLVPGGSQRLALCSGGDMQPQREELLHVRYHMLSLYL